jgi:hypothetical protein
VGVTGDNTPDTCRLSTELSVFSDTSCGVACAAGYSGNASTFECSTGSSVPTTAIECTPDDCSALVPRGAGYKDDCSWLVTDATCTQTCATGYTDNNDGNGQTYTCPAGTLTGTLLECSGAVCSSAEVSNSNKKSTGSISGVTGDSIEVVCDDGYSGGGNVTCGTNGKFSSVSCTPDDCSATVPSGAGYNIECSGLVTGASCKQTCKQGYSDNNAGLARLILAPAACSRALCWSAPRIRVTRSVSFRWAWLQRRPRMLATHQLSCLQSPILVATWPVLLATRGPRRLTCALVPVAKPPQRSHVLRTIVPLQFRAARATRLSVPG